MRRHLFVLGFFTALAVAYTWPLVAHLSTHIGPNTGDPTLNASVLWWNATHVPLTSGWWNEPWFHPVTGVTAFTESLLGLWPIAAPAYWLTHSPIVAYNVTFFATWPLSAFAMYWLVRRLTARTDAAIVAGLAFGFTPYRAAVELGHLQSLAIMWLPIGLAALHAYLETSRRLWLVVFGVAWVLQSLANGYYMLFGAMLIALWLAYFGSTIRTFRAAIAIVGAWVCASVVLVPVLVGYSRIHEQYGLHRTFGEARVFSAHPDSWVHVSDLGRAWRDAMPNDGDRMFPGLMVVAIVVAGILFALSGRRRREVASRRRTALQWTVAALAMLSAAAVVAWLGFGTWSIRAAGVTLVSMNSPDRALLLFGACSVVLLFIAPVWDALVARRPMVFYAVMVVVMAVLACGPVVTVRDQVLLDPAPYRWLMALPGFDQLRVPSRFWMMGVLCLSVSAGLAYASLVRRAGTWRVVVLAVAAIGVLADGWLTAMPMEPVPAAWSAMPGEDSRVPLLELPIGPSWDNAATLHTTSHGRPVMNGVSGYDPPHYRALVDGLRVHDPQMLEAIASLGAFEVSIDRAIDRTGRELQYVLAAPGAVRVAEDENRVIVRVPAKDTADAGFGAALPIASMRASSGDASRLIDRRLDTDWVDSPQHPNQWLLADLGSEQTIGAVSLAIGERAGEYPRWLAIEVSNDGEHFEQLWEKPMAAPTFAAIVRTPRNAWLRLAIPVRTARFVRIRQIGEALDVGWSVAEIEINAPKPGRE